MMKIVSDPVLIDRDQWRDFVNRNAGGNTFQTPEMYDFLRAIRNYHPVVIAVLDEKDSIRAILLGVRQRERDGWAGMFSSRVIVWGGPLIGSGDENNNGVCLDILRAFVRKTSRDSIYLEIRNLFDTGRFREAFTQSGFVYREHLNFIVPTADSEEIERRMSASRRRQIRKSLALGTRIVEAENLFQVREFHRILVGLYREKVRKPLPDWSFFEKFFLHRDRLGVILLVLTGDTVIGGILCPIFNKDALYEWYVCGLDELYPRHYPSVMATWAAIDYAQKKGIKHFDFLGAGSPERDYGVREFKARFGGDSVGHGRYMRINHQFLFELGKLGLKMAGGMKRI